MKKINFLLFIFIVNLSFAQEHIITLTDEPIDIEISGFYISNIIDNRPDKENIGIVKVGLFNKKKPAVLSDGLEKSMLSYLTKNLIQDSTKIPMTIVVNHFLIKETTDFSKEYGIAELKVEFKYSEDIEYGKIHVSQFFIEETALDVTFGHDYRIREVIKVCLEDFNTSEWRSTKSSSITADSLFLEDPIVSESSSYNHDSDQRFSLLNYNSIMGKNASGWGLSYSMLHKNNDTKSLAGFTIGLESLTLDQDYFNSSGYLQAELKYSMLGFSYIRELNDYFFMDLTLQLPFGSETLTEFNGQEELNYIFGLSSNQRILFVPKSKFGVTIGVGIYERVLTSQVYEHDYGVKLDIGIKF